MDIMDYIVEQAQADERARRVIVPSRVKATMMQLEDKEQDSVRDVIRAIEYDGLDNIPGVSVRKVDRAKPFYVLHPDSAPDILIFVSPTADARFEVSDIVRPKTLRNFANAR